VSRDAWLSARRELLAKGYSVAEYSQFVSTCRSSPGVAAHPNTVLTPERGLYT
jgi:hypothetical protein